jgi:hypothetical protein
MRFLQSGPLLCLVAALNSGSTTVHAAATSSSAAPETPPPNTLTDAEMASGWRLLFDGATTRGWRGFKRDSFPGQGWVVRDGLLIKQQGVRGGDIVTSDAFLDFELSWEWRIGPGGNSGVKYFVTEEDNRAAGHEYQMIDDARVRDPKGTTASFYDVLPPSPDKPAPRIDDWNQSRIVVRDRRVEHWLNGIKVLDYEPGSLEVLAAVAASKFKNSTGFGFKSRGRILLTDHTDEAHFRNIKIRVPPPVE